MSSLNMTSPTYHGMCVLVQCHGEYVDHQARLRQRRSCGVLSHDPVPAIRLWCVLYLFLCVHILYVLVSPGVYCVCVCICGNVVRLYPFLYGYILCAFSFSPGVYCVGVCICGYAVCLYLCPHGLQNGVCIGDSVRRVCLQDTSFSQRTPLQWNSIGNRFF